MNRDDDSGMESDYTSDMTSITSSNYIHTQRGSRRHHGILQNPYPLPNDIEEQLRLDEQHFAMSSLFGGNILVKFRRRPTRILDVGTGSGRWAIEVADDNPRTQVIGLDLSPMQPTDVPENCEFIIGDLTVSLVDFNDDSFDLVHSRFIQGGVKETEWQNYVNEAYRILKPGGWAQMGEIGSATPITDDDSLPYEAPMAEAWLRILAQFGRKHNLVLNGEHLEGRFRLAGFEDIKVIVKKYDIGDWRGNERTAAAARAAQNAYSAVSLAGHEICRDAYPDEEKLMEFLDRASKDWYNPNYHVYLMMHTVIGKKPDVVL